MASTSPTWPLFSIIVPAFNEQEFLSNTLIAIKQAIAEQTRCGEIIVVNNNSSDRTREIAQSASVRVIDEPINQISRARNSGAKAAHGEVFVFVDADTLINAQALTAALDAMFSNRACGGGAQIGLDKPHGMGDLAVGLWNGFARKAKFAAGCFVFCRRDAFDAIGGFSEKVFASEEIWLARDLKRWGKHNGYQFLILNEIIVTSARKLEWLSTYQIIKQIVVITLFPFALRSRRFCAAWYSRPDVDNKEQIPGQ